MTGSVSPLANALRLLRADRALSREPGGPREAATGAAAAVAKTGLPRGSTATALQLLPARLKALRIQTGGKIPRAKALRLFVEAALLQEFGPSLQLDPAFGELVERTCEVIEKDPGSANLLADALAELQALAD